MIVNATVYRRNDKTAVEKSQFKTFKAAKIWFLEKYGNDEFELITFAHGVKP
jgi:hypothetical protein